LLDTPSIGCAKSLLCGTHDPVANEAGAYRYVVDGDETIGAALRTRPDTNLVYVSIGHRVDLDAALHWVMACTGGYRLPEPCRLAHLLATRGQVPDTRLQTPNSSK
ncbi:MAG: endonuclease V, partial [Chloroflexota bacterium]